MKSKSRNANSRCGFSLMELLLVLAILFMFSAVAMPTVTRTLASHSLRKGADMFRTALGQARVKSIKSGDIFAVFYSPDGDYFQVAPFSKAAQIIDKPENEVIADILPEDRLPRQIRFAAGETQVNARAAQALQTGSGSRMKMILFYPDGTSQSAKIVLQNDKGATIQVNLRGLTGTSSTQRMSDLGVRAQ